MKKLVMAVALAVVAGVQTTAQGLIDFRNRITGTLDVPVFDVDGVTPLAGPDYVAQLYFSLTQAGSYTPVSGAPAVFRTGAGAGYWNAGTDSTRVLFGIQAGSTAWLQVRVWDGTCLEPYPGPGNCGGYYGMSTPFSVVAGGTPPIGAPLTPAVMLGLASFRLVPEPSTIALGVLGVAGLWFLSRFR